MTEDVPSPSQPGPDGSEQGWGAPHPTQVRASRRHLVTLCSPCSPQWRVELHWEDFQRGGPAGILRVREFYTPCNCHGAGSTNRRVLNPQATAASLRLTAAPRLGPQSSTACALWTGRTRAAQPPPRHGSPSNSAVCPAQRVCGDHPPTPTPLPPSIRSRAGGQAQGWPSGGLQLIHRL